MQQVLDYSALKAPRSLCLPTAGELCLARGGGPCSPRQPTRDLDTRPGQSNVKDLVCCPCSGWLVA
jgi:hypothetical protein